MPIHMYPKNGRVILHVDMNCFYASVEMAYNPKLKGKPLAIAGNPEQRKGIIVTSSYEARAKGVKTTMAVWQARRLCPELILLPPNFDRYRAASKEIFRLMSEITPLVEPVSIDEGYLDITSCASLGTPLEIAVRLQEEILKRLDLPCSIGIAPNKFLAKTASDMKKPMGITVLRKRELPNILWPQAVGEMHGVGDKTAEKLKQIGIHTIGDLANADLFALKSLLGVNGERLRKRANGEDSRPVDPEAVNEFKSIGSSRTLPHDTVDEDEISLLLRSLSENVERRLKRKQAAGFGIQLMIRYHDWKMVTRSRTLAHHVNQADDIYQIASDLFRTHWNGEAVRLLGITVQDAMDKNQIGEQLDLFTYEKAAERETLHKAVEQLKEKYGANLFVKPLVHKNDAEQLTSFQKDFLDDYKR
ncbi:DNA polymerase IV [Aciduricibacillus chroicocephali]|uniref:DNA polymerase IV n=1 Tax=Aciduricibacillus chroicocephali TaxID=3054939 RepID=A0ABY9KRQ7_9BACI|nr:DNA polymerase IV [Bacillaceae bacterium 44XB]